MSSHTASLLLKNNPTEILIVDNNPESLAGMSQFIENLGFTADTATDGFEAVETLKHSSYSLIITDLNTPSINGIELHRHIRKYHQETELILIVDSLNDLPVSEVAECGAVDYLCRPIRSNEFRAKVEKAIRDKDTIKRLSQQVAELQMANEQARERTEFFSSVIQSLAHPLYVINVDDYTVEFANESAGLGGGAGEKHLLPD